MKLLIFILCLIIFYICLYLILFHNFNTKPINKPIQNSTFNTNNHHNHHNTNTNTNHKCDIKSCGALDPVSDPKYNMQQIVKQSILLEEHLTNKNKRCRDCITKHFQHIIGLAEEAQMLATTKCNKYPLLTDSVTIYNNLFNEWFNNRNDENKILEISDKLRIHRKKLIAIYFFDDNYDIKNFSTSSQG
jgi:hypothetical protein